MSVIVNSSLVDSNIFKILVNSYKTRISSSTIRNTLIFPSSGVVFLLTQDDPCLSRPKLINEIVKLSEQHKNGIVLSIEPPSINSDYKLFFFLQNRLVDFGNVRVLFARNDLEAFQCIDSIVKANHKASRSQLQERTSLFQPQWTDVERLEWLRRCGFHEHESYALLENLGSVASIVSTCFEDLLECLQDRQLAEKAFSTFN